MRALLSITKALADQNRIRILCALAQRGELCVCQLQELLALAPSSTSKHLSLLAAAGLVEARKQGRWSFYRLTPPAEVPEGAAVVLRWLCDRAAQAKTILADQCLLDAILRYSPEELCQRQAEGKECCSSAPATPAGAKSPRASRVPSRRT